MLSPTPRPLQRGFSIVELMVGITVGLIVAAGASMVALGQINEHRRLMLETQLQQDLRTAADLLQQDLRRAGFRGAAENNVWAPAKAVGSLQEQAPQLPTASPYAAFSASAADSGTMVRYLYARQDPTTLKYKQSGPPSSNEYFGVRWVAASKTLYTQLGLGADGQPNWQPITDPETVKIESFTLEPVVQSVSLGEFCDKPCGNAGEPACPTQEVREIRFSIVGRAKHDANVVRTLSGVERIRADVVNGVCPP